MGLTLCAVFLSTLAFALAGTTSYGPPSPVYGTPSEDEYVPQIFRHVYVHTAPDEPTDVQSRVIRVPGGDRHVNIIFVKTPSQSSRQETQVILPEQDEHKNLVYVLLKKAENTNDVKIRQPLSRGPQKPEVYFIRYKGDKQEGYAPPARDPLPVRAPSSTYGTPF